MKSRYYPEPGPLATVLSSILSHPFGWERLGYYAPPIRDRGWA